MDRLGGNHSRLTLPADHMEYLFSLLLATPYYFTVAAVNELGRRPFSQRSLITTNSTSKSYTTVRINVLYVTRFAKTSHNDKFLEIRFLHQ